MLHHFISASTTVYANITSFVLHFLICSCFILSKKLMVAMVWPYRYYYFLAPLYVYSLYFLKEKKSLKFWTVVLFDKIMNESLENFCAVLALIAIFLHKVSMNEVLYLYSWYDNILFVYCHIFTAYHDFGWQFCLFLWWGLVVMTFFFQLLPIKPSKCQNNSSNSMNINFQPLKRHPLRFWISIFASIIM